MIYIIGDSHVSVFSGTDTMVINGQRHIQPEFGTQYTIKKGQFVPMNKFEQRIPYFCPIKIGSNTAYNSYNKLPIIEQVIEEYEITKDDYIYLCFGEIDIRNHIGQNSNRHFPIEEVIKECIERYIKTISHLVKTGLNIGVYGAIASSIGTPSLRGFSDVVVRNKMTLRFNEILKTRCEDIGVDFRDISKKLMLPDGTTDERYLMDELHLGQLSMPIIKDEFKDIICKIDMT